ncbi:MAG: hypothetical protein SFU98_11695 [Leptospiraceae bacterium]|nr:hypothetical protein [Leptospiraceae bacterium]
MISKNDKEANKMLKKNSITKNKKSKKKNEECLIEAQDYESFNLTEEEKEILLKAIR